MNEILFLSAHKLSQLIETKALTPSELFKIQIEAAEQYNPILNCYHLLTPEYESPALVYGDDSFDANYPGYQSLPFSTKDLMCITGVETTAGSKILKGWKPPYTASVVQNLFNKGCRSLGMTNMDEFAMGSSNEYCAWEHPRNPYDISRVPGGSSGGAAVTVASGLAPLALGTDTGGSVRQPAAFCGIYGFKPTYGLFSRYGIIAYASSLDQVGIFTRGALDLAMAVQTISKPDPFDATCQAVNDKNYVEIAQQPFATPPKVGIIKHFLNPNLIEPCILQLLDDFVKKLLSLGWQIAEVDLPMLELSLPTYYIISCAECSSNLARYDGIRYGPAGDDPDLKQRYIKVRSQGFGPEVRRRILLGTYVLSAGYKDAYYNKAREVRSAISSKVNELLSDCDFLLTPTTPDLPFKFGSKTSDPVKMYTSDTCLTFVNLAGLPGVSVPVGFATIENTALPVGLHFTTKRFADERLLQLCYALEQAGICGYQPPKLIEPDSASSLGESHGIDN